MYYYPLKLINIEIQFKIRINIISAHCIDVAGGWKKDTPMGHLIKAACTLAPP